MKKRYVFLEHTADIKFRTYGKTLQEVFEHAIEALAEYMTDGQLPKKKKGKVIEVQGTDQESLLSNFIDELLFLVDAEHFLPLKGEVTLRGNNLKAEIYGTDTSPYQLKHIKAATYSEMYIKKTKEGWEAQVVLDV